MLIFRSVREQCRGKSRKQSSGERINRYIFHHFQSRRFSVGGNIQNTPPDLLHAAAKAGRKREDGMRKLFCEIDQCKAVIPIILFVQHAQHGGVAGNLPVSADCRERGPDKGIEPVKDSGQNHQIIYQIISVPVVLQFVEQDVAYF